MMHIKIPFLAVLIISIIQITIYGLENNNYSKKSFDEIIGVAPEEITEITLTDLEKQKHSVSSQDKIDKIITYFSQFNYQRLRNDETSYMPMQTMMLNIQTEDQTYFLIPYQKEILLDYKTYKVDHDTIDDADLSEIFAE